MLATVDYEDIMYLFYYYNTSPKCHVASLRSFSMTKNSYNNQRKSGKKEKSRPSILYKEFWMAYI
jgi:hypothetical protein